MLKPKKSPLTSFHDVSIALLLLLLISTPGFHASAADLGEKTVTMWAPHLEWSLEAPGYRGNPFDRVGWVTFRHEVSGEQHRTQMFYDGGNTWKFRFTGTRLGEWTFSTTSEAPELNGHFGKVEVSENPDDSLRGFLSHQGNRYVVRTGNTGRLEAYLFNVYMNGVRFPRLVSELPQQKSKLTELTTAYLNDARQNGFEIIFLTVVNSWFRRGVNRHDAHSSVNPDSKTFESLETIITTAHRQGGRVHFWAWGDEARKWTPIGVGGINGVPDRRLQRYIAARLGPLPGWTMGYGFDLHEWVDAQAVNKWASHLHQHFGWQHLLAARGQILAGNNNMNSYDGFGRDVPLVTTAHGPRDYEEIVEDLAEDQTRPHLYEERHSHLRPKFALTMDGTRRLLWWEAMAGGMGGFWGFYPDSPHPYPNPEQLRTHFTFWHTHKRFLPGMLRSSSLGDGYALADLSRGHYVFYKEATDSIQIDLVGMPGPRRAVAVDTRKEYAEIDLGELTPGLHSITLPQSSDWAMAIGRFD